MLGLNKDLMREDVASIQLVAAGVEDSTDDNMTAILGSLQNKLLKQW